LAQPEFSLSAYRADKRNAQINKIKRRKSVYHKIYVEKVKDTPEFKRKRSIYSKTRHNKKKDDINYLNRRRQNALKYYQLHKVEINKRKRDKRIENV
jgi:hypothetical protein